MSQGYTGDPLNFDKTVLDASWIYFTGQTKNLGSHPIIQGRNSKERISRILSFTGQSLKGPLGSVPLLKLTDLAYDIDRDLTL